MAEPRKAELVVEELFTSLKTTVNTYGPGAIAPDKRIQGTAFFPGGSGLWQGTRPFGNLPDFFPERSVLFLGHNFDSVSSFNASVNRGIEKMSVGTWKYLLEYLYKAGVSPDRAFYTNVLMGLQPVSSRGKMVASAAFYFECRAFLSKQIAIIRPRLVAVMGNDARDQWELCKLNIPAVFLIHPAAIWCNRSAEEREQAIKKQAALLGSVK